MADFNVNIPEVPVSGAQAPTVTSSGAVAAQTLGDVSQGLGSTLSGLFEGRQQHQKMLQAQQAGAAEGDLTLKLNSIADAVDQGQFSSAVGRMKARALTGQAIANNPLLTNQLTEVHKSFLSKGGTGQVVGEGTEQEQQTRSLISQAQKDGFGKPTDTMDEQVAQMHNWQQIQNDSNTLKLLSEKQNFRNSQLTEVEKKQSIRAADQAYVTGGITQANAALTLQKNQEDTQARHAVGSLTQGYTTKIFSSMDALDKRVQNHEISPEEAIMEAQRTMASVNATTNQALGGFSGTYGNDVTGPVKDVIASYSDKWSGKTAADVAQNNVNNALGRASLNVIASSPEAAKVIATSSMLKTPGALQSQIDSVVVKALGQNGDPTADNVHPAPSSQADQNSLKGYHGVVLNTMGNIGGNNKTVDNHALKNELANNVESTLQSVHDYQFAVKDPKNYNNLVDMMADPRFGQYMASDQGGLHKESAAAAKLVLQRDYQDVAVKLMRNEFFTKINQPNAQVANTNPFAMIPDNVKPVSEDTRAQKIQPVWDGQGVTFVPKDANPDDATLVSARDLNKNVKPLLMKLIRMDSHLEGSTNYKKTWEDRYAPNFAPEQPKQEEAPANPQ